MVTLLKQTNDNTVTLLRQTVVITALSSVETASSGQVVQKHCRHSLQPAEAAACWDT